MTAHRTCHPLRSHSPIPADSGPALTGPPGGDELAVVEAVVEVVAAVEHREDIEVTASRDGHHSVPVTADADGRVTLAGPRNGDRPAGCRRYEPGQRRGGGTVIKEPVDRVGGAQIPAPTPTATPDLVPSFAAARDHPIEHEQQGRFLCPSDHGVGAHRVSSMVTRCNRQLGGRRTAFSPTLAGPG